MARFYVVAISQIIASLVTTQHVFASQDFHSRKQPFWECSREGSTIKQESPCQKAHPSTHITVRGVADEEGVVSAQSVLPPSSATSVDTAEVLLQKSPAAEEPSSSMAFSQGEAGGGETSLGAEPGDFQCTVSDGQRRTFRFHKILRVDVRGIFLDVEDMRTASREVFFGSFCPVAQSDQSRGIKSPGQLKSELVARLNREFSVFHPGISKEVLRKEYGLVIPKDYCAIPDSKDALELGEPGSPRPLLNLFVILPEVLTDLCSVDVPKLTPEAVVSMSIDVVRRVGALHKLNILHRKIDCSSILVSLSVPYRHAPRVYLGNFTVAQTNTGTEQPYSPTAAMKALDPSLASAAFSPLKHRLLIKFTKEQDAWATGILLYFLICNGQSDPFGIYAAPASKLVLLRRTIRLKEHLTRVKFKGCLPAAAHPAVPLLRILVDEFLNPDEETRTVPEEAISRFPQLFSNTGS